MTCPECGDTPRVPKHFPFLRCWWRVGPECLSAHGFRGSWFACCGVFTVTPAGFGEAQDLVMATYRPGQGRLAVADDDFTQRYFGQHDSQEFVNRFEALALPPPDPDLLAGVTGGEPARLVLCWKHNLVESVHHEMFSYWLACAGPGAPVTIVDCTPLGLAHAYWPEDDGAQRWRRPVDWWLPVLRAALHDENVELPWAYHSWPTTEPAVRAAFRRFLDAAFGPPDPVEPTALICLRWNHRRWTTHKCEQFIRLCRERLGARIVVQGMAPGTTGNAIPPQLPEGVEALIDASIAEQVAVARQATYCVIPHGAAMLWSWISAAPTLEMYPSPAVKTDALMHFSTLPLGADVRRMETNGRTWTDDFNVPTAEEAFAAMMEHAEEAGACLT